MLTPLDEAAVPNGENFWRWAAGRRGPFLHSYINPAHERRATEIVHALWPNAYITAGHAVLSNCEYDAA